MKFLNIEYMQIDAAIDTILNKMDTEAKINNTELKKNNTLFKYCLCAC